MGYPVGYPISSGPISSRGIGKSSLNTIPLNWYRDGILVGYPVGRYICGIVPRSGIFVGYPSGG